MVNLWIALTLGVIFIIIPIVVMGMAGVNMVGKMMKGLFSMALRVGIIGSIVYWLVQWDSIALMPTPLPSFKSKTRQNLSLPMM